MTGKFSLTTPVEKIEEGTKQHFLPMKQAFKTLKTSLKTKDLDDPKDLDVVRQQIKDYDTACRDAEKFINNLNTQYVDGRLKEEMKNKNMGKRPVDSKMTE